MDFTSVLAVIALVLSIAAILFFSFGAFVSISNPCFLSHNFCTSRFCPDCGHECYDLCQCGERVNPMHEFCKYCGRSHDSDGGDS